MFLLHSPRSFRCQGFCALSAPAGLWSPGLPSAVFILPFTSPKGLSLESHSMTSASSTQFPSPPLLPIMYFVLHDTYYYLKTLLLYLFFPFSFRMQTSCKPGCCLSYLPIYPLRLTHGRCLTSVPGKQGMTRGMPLSRTAWETAASLCRRFGVKLP